jgi:hypothetical protein
MVRYAALLPADAGDQTVYPRWAMSEDDPILVCCPCCCRSLGTIEEPGAPFKLPARCPRCGEDPRRDAPLEMTLSAWAAMPKKTCKACKKKVPKLATRCGECKAKL